MIGISAMPRNVPATAAMVVSAIGARLVNAPVRTKPLRYEFCVGENINGCLSYRRVNCENFVTLPALAARLAACASGENVSVVVWCGKKFLAPSSSFVIGALI